MDPSISMKMSLIVFTVFFLTPAVQCCTVTRTGPPITPTSSTTSTTTTGTTTTPMCIAVETASPPFVATQNQFRELITKTSVTAACDATNTAAVGDTITYDCVLANGNAASFTAMFANVPAPGIVIGNTAVLMLQCTAAGWQQVGNTVANNVLTATNCI